MTTTRCLAALALAAMTPLAAQANWVRNAEAYVRNESALAYDPARGKVVMFGGHIAGIRAPRTLKGGVVLSTDTWEWDGVRWALRESQHAPPPRLRGMLAFDPVRKTMILYGGYDLNTGTTPLSDTWEWDGHDWTQLNPTNSPGPRFSACIDTDWARGRILMFGGGTVADFTMFGNRRTQSDTWEWSGSNWVQLNPQTIPPARWNGGMGFCAASGRITMYGGGTGQGPLVSAETWEWTGSDWFVHPGTSPVGPRGAHGMTGDPRTGHVVLFGGNGAQTGNLQETWDWDGSTWTQLQPAHQPSVRSRYPILVRDARGDLISYLHYGGERGRWATWSWNGVDWREVDATRIFYRDMYVAYDERNDRTVIVSPQPYSIAPAQTWQLVDGELSQLQLAVDVPNDLYLQIEYHAGLGGVVAYGQKMFDPLTGQQHQQTWLLEKTGWRQLNTAHVPGPPNEYIRTVYDRKRDRIVALLRPSSQTWVFDGTDWSQLPTTTTPALVPGMSLAYDLHRDRIVLLLVPVPGTPETWEFDGTDWARIATPSLPAGFGLGRMGYHPGLRRVVLCEENLYAARFTWNGQTWAPLQTRESLTYGYGMWQGGLVYDTHRQRLRAVYSGVSGDNSENVWDLILERLTVDDHLARLGSTLTYRAEFRGHGGQRWLLALSGQTRPSIPLYDDPDYGVVDLPLAPTLLLQASVAANLGGTLDPQGIGTATVTIPNDPALVDYGFDAAAVTVDLPRAQITGVSNPVHVWVVR